MHKTQVDIQYKAGLRHRSAENMYVLLRLLDGLFRAVVSPRTDSFLPSLCGIGEYVRDETGMGRRKGENIGVSSVLTKICWKRKRCAADRFGRPV
jgi:hypothetical protein